MTKDNVASNREEGVSDGRPLGFASEPHVREVLSGYGEMGKSIMAKIFPPAAPAAPERPAWEDAKILAEKAVEARSLLRSMEDTVRLALEAVNGLGSIARWTKDGIGEADDVVNVAHGFANTTYSGLAEMQSQIEQLITLNHELIPPARGRSDLVCRKCTPDLGLAGAQVDEYCQRCCSRLRRLASRAASPET